VDNANTPIPEILLGVPWRHQTVIVSKCDTINAALFYLNKVVEDNMSRTELEYVIKSQLYEHTEKAYFPDMIFYHTRLKCYVVVELKIVDFMPEFIGKLNFYVSAADELLKGEGDNPSIGILLCKDKDSSVVEWSLRGITTPLGVASYQLQEVYERTLLEIKQESAEEEDSAK
jgi:hypothetical protein